MHSRILAVSVVGGRGFGGERRVKAVVTSAVNAVKGRGDGVVLAANVVKAAHRVVMTPTGRRRLGGDA